MTFEAWRSFKTITESHISSWIRHRLPKNLKGYSSTAFGRPHKEVMNNLQEQRREHVEELCDNSSIISER